MSHRLLFSQSQYIYLSFILNNSSAVAHFIAGHAGKVADPRVEHARLGLARVHGTGHVVQLHPLAPHRGVRAPVQKDFGVQLGGLFGRLAVPKHLREAVLDCCHGFSGTTLVNFQLRYCGIELRDLRVHVVAENNDTTMSQV